MAAHQAPPPWDSPGKNTGVGCHFFFQCMKVKSESEVAQSCPTLSDPMDCSLPGSSIHGIFQARVQEWMPLPLLWVTTSQQLSQLYQPAATENVIRFASKSPLIPDLHAFPNTPKRYYQPSLLKTDVPDQLSPLPIVGNNLTFVFHFRYWVVVSSLVDRSNHENKTDLGISNKDKKI